MSFTLRQVEPLLTKVELELFRSSRAPAIRTLTPRQLASRIQRARALRDKHRDKFRRQTVAARTGPAAARQRAGAENQRTGKKADIMAEVLQRLEAQHEKLLARQGTAEAAPVKTAPTKKAAVKKVTGKKTAAKKTTATKASAKKTPAKSAAVGTAQSADQLMKQVRKAAARKQAAAPVAGAPRASRGIRARVGGSASDLAQGAVPTGMSAKTQRLNPLKAQPVNKKIHASARSRQKLQTARRDSR